MADFSPYKPGPAAADFAYPVLSEPCNQFRLLQCPAAITDGMCFVMRTYFLHEMVERYVAVSYVWGDTASLVQITINGQPFCITRTAELALRQVRRNRLSDYLWLDAICINLADNGERGQQVRNMGLIYFNAHGTAASTGMTTGFGQLFERIERASSPIIFPQMAAHTRVDGKAFDEECRNVDRELDDLPYFKRMWILQELVSARKIFFMHEDSCEGPQDLLELCQECYGRSSQSNMYLPSVRIAMIAQEISDRDRDNKNQRDLPLVEAIAMYSGGACTDPRDRVYSLLGLVRKRDHDLQSGQHRSNSTLEAYPINYSADSFEALFDFIRSLKDTDRLTASSRAITQLLKYMPIDWNDSEVQQRLLSEVKRAGVPKPNQRCATFAGLLYRTFSEVRLVTDEFELFARELERMFKALWMVEADAAEVISLVVAPKPPLKDRHFMLRPLKSKTTPPGMSLSEMIEIRGSRLNRAEAIINVVDILLVVLNEQEDLPRSPLLELPLSTNNSWLVIRGGSSWRERYHDKSSFEDEEEGESDRQGHRWNVSDWEESD